MNQKELLSRIKKYLNFTSRNSNNQNFYLSSFSSTPGYIILKKLQKENIRFFVEKKIKFQYFLASLRLSYTKIFFKKISYNFNSIILTWGNISDFKKNGSFEDKYFNQNSRRNKKFLWFIISLDNKTPRKIDPNIIIFLHNNLNYINFIYSVLKILKRYFLGLFYSKKKASLSYLENLSFELWNKLDPITKNKNLKKIIMPYEAQPFQNYIFNKIKINYKSIKSIGYVHSTQPFPSHLFKREGSPDKIYVHGNDQKYHCNKYLGWKKNQVKSIPSFRFLKKNKNNFVNKVLLPYDFYNLKIILQLFENLITSDSEKVNSNLQIKMHPRKKKSKKHILLREGLTKILKENRLANKISVKTNTSIIIGATSATLEALESGIEPYHLCEDKVFEMCSEHLWPSIKVREIFKNCYQYKLKKFNNCINYKKLSNKTNLNYFK